MNPREMDDGNLMVFYNHPAYNIVLEEVTAKHMDAIRANHQKGLARAEVATNWPVRRPALALSIRLTEMPEPIKVSAFALKRASRWRVRSSCCPRRI